MIETTAPGVADRRWTLVAWAYGVLVAAILGYFLLGLTIQLSDSFGNLLALQRPTLRELLEAQFSQRGYLRPLLWAQLKVVFDLSDGQYYWWYRGIHVAQVFALVGLCLALLRPKTAVDAALVPLALAVLVGVHTFAPTVREAFPINTFLTIMLCCAGVACLACTTRRWWTDGLALVLFVFATLTLETGLLVWVVCATAYLVGMRGISRGAVASMTVLLVAYVVLRMAVLDIGSPGLSERAAGFGFQVVEPADLARRFRDKAILFYMYNVVSSVATVLFSEPKGGVWRFAYEISLGNVHPWTLVSVTTSAAATAVIAWFAWTERRRWRAREFDHDDRLVILFLTVLGANAVLSYPYAKNAVMSPSGMFLALAVFAAVRRWIDVEAPRRAAITIVLCGVLGIGWAFRAAGLHYNLRRTAALQRNEWVFVDRWIEQQRLDVGDADARALKETLYRDAVWVHQAPPQFSGTWTRWFDIDW